MLLVIAIAGGVVSGTTVLTLMLTVLSTSAPSVLELAAASLNVALATLIMAGVVLLAVGVKVAV